MLLRLGQLIYEEKTPGKGGGEGGKGKKKENSPVAVEISTIDLVAVAGGELLAAEDELDSHATVGRSTLGEDDYLAGAVGTGRTCRVADGAAGEPTRRHAHTWMNLSSRLVFIDWESIGLPEFRFRV